MAGHIYDRVVATGYGRHLAAKRALGIHRAIASRLVAMIRRVGLRERFVFAEGDALNACLRGLLAGELAVLARAPDCRPLGAAGL